MATIAIYSAKGGVGKTSLAVNLAWASATLSSRRTLLWDLDAQAASSFILSPDRAAGKPVQGVLTREIAPDELIVPTVIPGVDLLPADASLRSPDLILAELDAKRRLQKIGEQLARSYDRVIVDCPPGLGVTADHIIRGATLILVPEVPASLSTRVVVELRAHLTTQRKATPPIMTVFNLVDRRRGSHRAMIAAAPDKIVIPASAAMEQMADRHAPLALYAPRSPAVAALGELWRAIERRLADAQR